VAPSRFSFQRMSMIITACCMSRCETGSSRRMTLLFWARACAIRASWSSPPESSVSRRESKPATPVVSAARAIISRSRSDSSTKESWCGNLPSLMNSYTVKGASASAAWWTTESSRASTRAR